MVLCFLLSCNLPNAVSECSNDHTFGIYFQTAFPVASVKQLSERFCSIGKLQDPAAARQLFVILSTSRTAEILPTVALQRRQGTESEIDVKCLIVAILGHQFGRLYFQKWVKQVKKDEQVKEDDHNRTAKHLQHQLNAPPTSSNLCLQS